MTKHLVDSEEDEAGMKPAMLACPPRMRRFVRAYFANPIANLSDTVRAAGYCENSTNQVVAATAQKLIHDKRIIAAIGEMAGDAMRSDGPKALEALRDILADKEHPQRAKVALAFMERASPTVQNIAVTHEVITPKDRDKDIVKYLRELIEMGVARAELEKKFGYSDLPRYEKLLAIEDAAKSGASIEDAEFVEVSADEDRGW